MKARTPAKRRAATKPVELRASGHQLGYLDYDGPSLDRGLLAVFLNGIEHMIGKRTLCEELDRRGYDLRTLRFSIRRKKPSRRRPG